MLTVAFVHVGEDTSLARIMVASVRRAMPGARLVHLTDESTAGMAGVDEVVRHPYDGTYILSFRLKHLAELAPCDAVFLDTDVIVQQDLGPVFDMAFDVALTRRENIGTDPNGIDIAAVMPYNAGVMLSRPAGWAFWDNVWRQCQSYPDEIRRWWGEQYALRDIATVAPLRLLELPCDRYNYTPATESEDVSSRAVVHYKGKRKAWMKNRAAQDPGLAT
jgi:hypothetical protein